MARQYHLLLASLPHLSAFERLRALPVSPQRFEARLALLDPADATILASLRGALWPERESMRPGSTDDGPLPPMARTLADHTASIRRAFALRRGEEDMVTVERDRLRALWDAADRALDADGFGLDAVLRAVVRWDIATAWLARDARRSSQRITDLADRLIEDWRLDAAA